MWPETKPIKFIVWGHEHYSHTHSYIHYGFFKAAKYIGWDVQWLNNTLENNVKLGNTDGCLFITEGQVDSNMPKNPNAFYVLHNCNGNDYSHIPETNKLTLQVYTKDVHSYNVVPVKQNLFEYWQEDGNMFYMPWATDILPHEIDQNISNLQITSSGDAVFVGTYAGGYFGNINEINAFSSGCKKNGVNFKVGEQNRSIEIIKDSSIAPSIVRTWQKTRGYIPGRIFKTVGNGQLGITNSKETYGVGGGLAVEQNRSIEIIKDSFMAPSIVGTWQKEKGYIPCRIFKTVSYGQLGITNSKEAYEVINKLGVYNIDEQELAGDALKKINDIELRKDAMKFVRDNHTYLNRIESLRHIFQLKISA
jgi:hypothetical protein